MSKLIRRDTLSVRIISIVMLISISALGWALYSLYSRLANIALEESINETKKRATELVFKLHESAKAKKEEMRQGQLKEFKRTNLGENEYACVMYGQKVHWVSDKQAETYCSEKKLNLPIPHDYDGNQVLFNDFSFDYKEGLYQVRKGIKPLARIMVYQDKEQTKIIFRKIILYSFALPSFFFLFSLFALVYWVLRPLRHLEEEVKKLGSDRSDRISTVGYPQDLSHFAEVLQDFVLRTWNTRAKIVDQAFKLSGAMQHHRKNLLPSRSSADIDTLPSRRKLLERLLRIIESSDRFAAEICAIGDKDVSQRFKKIEIFDFFRTMTSIFEEDYPNLELRIEGLKQDMSVNAPPGSFEEVCFELLTNAGKYAEDNVLVRVARRNRSICLEFHNDGQRFPLEDRECMLHWDTRGNTDKEGTGRGLFFVKQRVDAWGGSVELRDSNELEGACVRIEVPAA